MCDLSGIGNAISGAFSDASGFIGSLFGAAPTAETAFADVGQAPGFGAGIQANTGGIPSAIDTSVSALPQAAQDLAGSFMFGPGALAPPSGSVPGAGFVSGAAPVSLGGTGAPAGPGIGSAVPSFGADSNTLMGYDVPTQTTAPVTPTGTPTPTPGTTPKVTTGEQLLNNPSWGNLGKFALNNLGPLVSAAGIGLSALRGNQIPGLGNIQNQANQLAGQGSELRNALLSGKLPAGAQASVDEAVKAAQAQVRSQYASMGLSGSTMETEALNQAALQGQQLAFQIASQMAQLGLGETSLSSDLFRTIMQAQLSNDAELQNAIVGFAESLAGGGPRVQLKLG